MMRSYSFVAAIASFENGHSKNIAPIFGPFTALTMEISQLLPSAAMYRSAGISRPLRSKNGSNERACECIDLDLCRLDRKDRLRFNFFSFRPLQRKIETIDTPPEIRTTGPTQRNARHTVALM